MVNTAHGQSSTLLLYAAWLIALTSAVGSLFFSEVMQLPPCSLCWYQRVAMYPLVFVIGTGIVLRDPRVKAYALPLALAGLGVAVYHNLLYYGVIPESLTPCTEGVPCNAVQIEWLGFITIPLMGLAAFVALNICLLAYRVSGPRVSGSHVSKGSPADTQDAGNLRAADSN